MTIVAEDDNVEATNSMPLDTTYTLPLDFTFIVPTSIPNEKTLASQPDGRLRGQEQLRPGGFLQ